MHGWNDYELALQRREEMLREATQARLAKQARGTRTGSRLARAARALKWELVGQGELLAKRLRRSG